MGSNFYFQYRDNAIEAEYLVEADDYQSFKEFPVKMKEVTGNSLPINARWSPRK
jgi:hypothetical protein